MKDKSQGFTDLMIENLKSTSKEVKQMDNEIHKKEKQVKFQSKLNKKNERNLK